MKEENKEKSIIYKIIQAQNTIDLEFGIPHTKEEKYFLYTATAMNLTELHKKNNKVFSEDFNLQLVETIRFLMIIIETIQIDLEQERGLTNPNHNIDGEVSDQDFSTLFKEIKNLGAVEKKPSSKKKNKDNNNDNIEI